MKTDNLTKKQAKERLKNLESEEKIKHNPFREKNIKQLKEFIKNGNKRKSNNS